MNEARSPEYELRQLFDAQRHFFDGGHTLSREFRARALAALRDAVRRHERDVADAVWADLHKCETEAYGSETAMILGEVRHALSHLRDWMRPSRFPAALLAQPGTSRIQPSPLGVNLVLGAWNYPVQLSVQPLVAAVAAGNTAVVKPSELAPESSAVVARIVREAFDPRHVACVEGGVDVSQQLLTLPWDHVFFTGGTAIGRVVARAAAEHLSRVTLELGGKSPAIVLSSANLEVAAARIAWGKWLNAGQTCIAPDYVLVHEDRRDELVALLRQRVVAMYGDDPRQSPDYGRLVSERHVERVRGLLDSGTVAFGGQVDAADRYIAPTVLTDVTPDDPVMGEEIFGPVLPVLTVRGVDDAIALVRQHRNPLALYLFTEVKAEQEKVIARVGFGGGCINNVTMHFSDPRLPFGGVGTSGTGAYHGKHGFDVFSHRKAVLESSSSPLLERLSAVKYPPYAGKLPLLKRLLG